MARHFYVAWFYALPRLFQRQTAPILYPRALILALILIDETRKWVNKVASGCVRNRH
jgi:hypothetical protein